MLFKAMWDKFSDFQNDSCHIEEPHDCHRRCYSDAYIHDQVSHLPARTKTTDMAKVILSWVSHHLSHPLDLTFPTHSAWPPLQSLHQSPTKPKSHHLYHSNHFQLTLHPFPNQSTTTPGFSSFLSTFPCARNLGHAWPHYSRQLRHTRSYRLARRCVHACLEANTL